MFRRHLLGLAAAPAAALWQATRPGAGTDAAVASATEDTTPRVAIVLSSFKGGEDHDGTRIKGLRSPCPTNAPLSAERLEDMLQKAIELGNTRQGDLAAIIGDSRSIVLKPQIAAYRNPDGALLSGSVADPRLVRALVKWIAANARVQRITIAEGPSWPGGELDAWASEWQGAFGTTSYRKIVNELAREYPNIRFDIVDLNVDVTMDMQPPERAGTSDSGVYKFGATLIKSDTLITVVPLATSARTAVSLTLGSYLGALPAVAYGSGKEKAFSGRAPSQVLVDLFSFRPPDYAIVGGEWALEGGGASRPKVSTVRHNVLLAGANAVAVDAVGAGVMGVAPSEVPHLQLAARKGFGTVILDSIWTRGNEIEEARHSFRGALSK